MGLPPSEGPPQKRRGSLAAGISWTYRSMNNFVLPAGAAHSYESSDLTASVCEPTVATFGFECLARIQLSMHRIWWMQCRNVLNATVVSSDKRRKRKERLG